ncbi:MAG TPA: D-2-hydroxyacid dehydrogenase family protein [Verrucomicrobiae bacterium]|jgi:phosphoglycerate dehydrogenase-like enzyme|nr:D-2-hydroxyacid dehydrogenase family protein [Verrucomicrobiae bacterium]
MDVAVIDDYQHAFGDSPAIARLRQKAQVRIFTEKFSTEEKLAGALKGTQAIIPIRERTRFTASLIEALPDLEFIAQTGNHAYHIDMAAATTAGIVVTLAPGGNSVTELTFGLMIAAMRRIPQSDAAMRRGEWPLVLGYVLKGKTLGILGLGKIGVEVAAIARAFGMKVIAWGPTLSADRADKSGAEYLPLDEVMRRSDVVSVHLKLSAQSKGLIDERRLRLMRPNSYLVNTARGAIVDENALARILKEKAIAGAALDVFVDEPLPKASPLSELDNVVLAPHLGWPTDAGFQGFAENAVENILSYLDGKLVRAINPEAVERRKRKSS